MQRARDLFSVIVFLLDLVLVLMLCSRRQKAEILLRQKHQMHLILDTTGEGILRFGSDFKIAPGHSRSAGTIVRWEESLAGRDVRDVLRDLNPC